MRLAKTAHTSRPWRTGYAVVYPALMRRHERMWRAG